MAQPESWRPTSALLKAGHPQLAVAVVAGAEAAAVRQGHLGRFVTGNHGTTAVTFPGKKPWENHGKNREEN